MAERAQFDILYIADFRNGDMDASSAVCAVQALSKGGYRIAVLPWIGVAAADPFQMDNGLRDLLSGSVRLVSAKAKISCKIILANDLRLFENRAVQTLNVSASQRVVICTRGGPETPSSLRAVIEHAEEALAGPVTLAPAAPAIRSMLISLWPDGRFTDSDWPPTVTAINTRARRSGDRVSLPILGYYRSAQCRKWPGDIESLQEILPDHPLLGLSVLGAPDELIEPLRRYAIPVSFEDPKTCAPDKFLSQLDAITTNADASDDPWPVEILQALIDGTIPVLQPDFRNTFMASALYVQPEDIADTVVDLFLSPDLMADLRVAAGELIDRMLAPKHLTERVNNLIGNPGPAALISRADLLPKGTVISISTNGVGMGHLARQMAIGKHLAPNLTPVFLGFSQSISVVRQFGWMSEYLPYHSGPAMHTGYWNEWLVKALDAACKFYDPRALVLDANVPFDAFNALRDLHPGLPMIWVRRAMWGPGRDLAALERAHLFDTVIEPGELAAAYDTGPTTQAHATVRQVDPIHLVERDEMLSREEAAGELGISPDTQNVLLLPGAMNNFNTSQLWAGITQHLGNWPDTSVVAAEWAISEQVVEWPAFVVQRKGFPYARWFNAFDFAVSAAGYNSFAELICLGLPTIFVPNENPLMDRQDLRALYAERHGLGLRLPADRLQNIAPVLDNMRDPAFRRTVRVNSQAAVAQMRNGALEAAVIISAWANSGLSHRSDGWQ